MGRISLTIDFDTVEEYMRASTALSSIFVRPSAEAPAAAAVQPTAASAAIIPTTVIPTPPTADQTDEPAETTSTAEFDSAGIPWDERIHAGTRGVNQDGTWKRRRNTSDVLYASVMAELSAKTAGQQPVTPPAPPVAQVPASPAAGNVDASAVPATPATVVSSPPMAAPPATAPSIPTPPVPAAPAIPPAPVAPVDNGLSDAVIAAAQPTPGMGFQEFMPKLAKAMNDKRFDQAALTGWLGQWGLTDVGQLSADRMKTEQFYQWLKSSNLID